ncbi:hypothetical protein Tco_0255044 [Tanacetum coccineum]
MLMEKPEYYLHSGQPRTFTEASFKKTSEVGGQTMTLLTFTKLSRDNLSNLLSWEVFEDPSKQGRSLIEELDLDAEISLVPPHDAEIQEKISIIHFNIDLESVLKSESYMIIMGFIFISFVPMDSEEEFKRLIRQAIDVKAKPAKKIKEQKKFQCQFKSKRFWLASPKQRLVVSLDLSRLATTLNRLERSIHWDQQVESELVEKL